jgi:SAM-dependent methyltransferase
LCLRLRLCRRRPLNHHCHESIDLPRFALCTAQADWLRGARSRLLRRAGIEHRHKIVELGAGWGIVASELCVRTGRRIVAIDRRPPPDNVPTHDRVDWLVAHAESLPLANDSVDLVFTQFALLWMDAARVMAEVARVLAPGGVVVAIEPDYGGLMEYPAEIASKSIWLSALRRAGADPCIGRKLPSLFAEQSLRVETRFPDRYELAQPERLDLLNELPLTADERRHSDRIAQQLQSQRAVAVAHLPLWMVLGEKPSESRQ